MWRKHNLIVNCSQENHIRRADTDNSTMQMQMAEHLLAVLQGLADPALFDHARHGAYVRLSVHEDFLGKSQAFLGSTRLSVCVLEQQQAQILTNGQSGVNKVNADLQICTSN